MIKIAITGGIGSGKSYISHLLETMDVPVYNADNEAKRLMVSDEGIHRELIALLGKEVYDKEGALNKPLLASYLFSAPEHVRQINAIIHPRVREDFIRWIGELKECEIAGMESAILYEAGFENTVDAVVMVYAPLELRVKRAMQRDNATEQQVRARILAQLDDEEKRSRAVAVPGSPGASGSDPCCAGSTPTQRHQCTYRPDRSGLPPPGRTPSRRRTAGGSSCRSGRSWWCYNRSSIPDDACCAPCGAATPRCSPWLRARPRWGCGHPDNRCSPE